MANWNPDWPTQEQCMESVRNGLAAAFWGHAERDAHELADIAMEALGGHPWVEWWPAGFQVTYTFKYPEVPDERT